MGDIEKIYDKECFGCKVASGVFMTGIGVYQASGVQWQNIQGRDKVFSVVMLAFVFGLAGLSFNSAYEIKMGKA